MHVGKEAREIGPGVRITDPSERIRLARLALERLLEAGLVALWRDRSGHEDELLSVDEAKAFVANDRNWVYDETDPPGYVTIALTDAGNEIFASGP
jgi:hypothetical protein